MGNNNSNMKKLPRYTRSDGYSILEPCACSGRKRKKEKKRINTRSEHNNIQVLCYLMFNVLQMLQTRSSERGLLYSSQNYQFSVKRLETSLLNLDPIQLRYLHNFESVQKPATKRLRVEQDRFLAKKKKQSKQCVTV